MDPPPASPSVFQEDAPHVDDAFAESMGFVTTYLRAVESARDDRIVNDPFAGPLTKKHKFKITELMKGLSSKRQLHSRPEDFIAFRTRYLDEAISQRKSQILQIVILGAGLDARAYRLESLRGCHVLEVDQAQDIFDHKTQVMKELNAPLIAQKVDYIVSDLAQSGLENSLVSCGFDPTVPTFWALEGLIPYIERTGILQLLKVIDHVSAPGSELWADIPGQFVADSDEWGKRAMKYGEDDPLSGVLSEINWALQVQASLGVAGDHFGRQWMPMLSLKTKQEVPFFLVIGKKPASEWCHGVQVRRVDYACATGYFGEAIMWRLIYLSRLLAIFQSIATMEEGGEVDDSVLIVTPAPASQNDQEVLPSAYGSADLTDSCNARPTPKPCFKRIHSLEIPDLEYENRDSPEDQEEFINVINSEHIETDNIDVCGRNEGHRYDCFTPGESSRPGELDELIAGPSLLNDTLLTYSTTSSTPRTNRVSGPSSLRQSKGRVSRKQQIQGLRETVAELTQQRDELQMMASTSSLEVTSPVPCPASQRVTSLLAKPQSIWEHIAAQQLLIRQNSEEENARLRDLIDQQKQQARNFRRMIRRRRDEELLDDHLSKRAKIRHNEEIFDELLQGLDELYIDLDKLFTEKNMAGVPCPGRERQVYPNATEGAEFVEFLDKNPVPFDFHRAENAVWAFLKSSRVCERQHGKHICATELKQSSCTSKSSVAFTYFEKGLTSYVSEQRVARKYAEENRTVFISRTLAEPTTCKSWSVGVRFIETMSVVVRRGDDMASGQETAIIESLISVSRCTKGDQAAMQCQWPAYVDTAAKGWGRKVSFNSQEIENLLLDMSIGQGKC